MFPLIETIKIVNGKPQNLSYHQHRFEASYYKLYNKLTNIRLNEVIKVPEKHRKGIVKLRFLYNQTDCFCQFENYRSKHIETLRLVYCDQIEYSLKWVNRKPIENLLLQKKSADDILIVKNDLITDTSFTNIAFWDGKNWITPQYPLLHGTARARLIHHKHIVPAPVYVSDLPLFKSFKLFNAMLDFERQPNISVANILI